MWRFSHAGLFIMFIALAEKNDLSELLRIGSTCKCIETQSAVETGELGAYQMLMLIQSNFQPDADTQNYFFCSKQ